MRTVGLGDDKEPPRQARSSQESDRRESASPGTGKGIGSRSAEVDGERGGGGQSGAKGHPTVIKQSLHSSRFFGRWQGGGGQKVIKVLQLLPPRCDSVCPCHPVPTTSFRHSVSSVIPSCRHSIIPSSQHLVMPCSAFPIFPSCSHRSIKVEKLYCTFSSTNDSKPN